MTVKGKMDSEIGNYANFVLVITGQWPLWSVSALIIQVRNKEKTILLALLLLALEAEIRG